MFERFLDKTKKIYYVFMEISLEDFKKIEIRAGKILSAEKVLGADRLLKLSVDVGEEAPRQIVSGIAEYFPDPQALIGKTFAFLANIAPRTIRGLESNGMILAMKSEGNFSLFPIDPSILPGTRAS